MITEGMRRIITGIMMGWCVMAWYMLDKVQIEYRYETYGFFLMFFGLFYVVAWWYPIYTTGKSENLFEV